MGQGRGWSRCHPGAGQRQLRPWRSGAAGGGPQRRRDGAGADRPPTSSPTSGRWAWSMHRAGRPPTRGRRASTGPGTAPGAGYAAQGNLLAGEGVVQALAETFEGTTGPLAERMLAALAAGDAAGGDRRGRQSACVIVRRMGGGYGGDNDLAIDLRVDDHSDPVSELQRLYALHDLMFGTTPEDELIPLEQVESESQPAAGPAGLSRSGSRGAQRLGRHREPRGAAPRGPHRSRGTAPAAPRVRRLNA